MLAGFSHEPAVELAERLKAVTPPGLDRCFFADNGSAAVEVALKMSYHFWRNQGRSEKSRFITLSGAYHGETLGALAVGNVPLYRDTYRPLLMEAISVPSPDCHAREEGETGTAFAEHMILEMEKILAEQANRVAAVIVEPLIQCAAGMRMVPTRLSVAAARRVQPLRGPSDRGRNRGGFRPHGNAVRVRTGRRLSGLSLPVEGFDRGLFAALRSNDDGGRLCRLL